MSCEIRLHTKPVEACGAECRGVCTGKPALEQTLSGPHLASQPLLNPAHIRAIISATQMSLPPRWAKARACPTPDTQIGGEYAKPGPPATCPISLTSRNSYVQFHLVSVSVHLVSVAPSAREWHRTAQNDTLFAENLAHGCPRPSHTCFRACPVLDTGPAQAPKSAAT